MVRPAATAVPRSGRRRSPENGSGDTCPGFFNSSGCEFFDSAVTVGRRRSSTRYRMGKAFQQVDILPYSPVVEPVYDGEGLAWQARDGSSVSRAALSAGEPAAGGLG